MIIQKIYYHLKSALKKLLYKLIYGNKISWGKITFRNGFNITIDGDARIVFGQDIFFNNNCSIHAMGGGITIGDGCIFGENVKIYDHNHRFSKPDIPIKKQGYTMGKIKIGDHCWIGSNVVILKGVCIGDNCVIGAGCVIKKNIESNIVVQCEQKLICNEVRK